MRSCVLNIIFVSGSPSKCGWKVNIGNIEKSRQYCLNENINHSPFIKWDKQKRGLSFVAKWHFQVLLIRMYMYKDMFITFLMEVSDVKIPWNAKSRRYFHFKLQQGDEETWVIFLCWGKLEKIKQKERNRLPAHVTNVGMPMVKYPQQRMSSSIAALSITDFKNNDNDWKKN